MLYIQGYVSTPVNLLDLFNSTYLIDWDPVYQELDKLGLHHVTETIKRLLASRYTYVYSFICNSSHSRIFHSNGDVAIAGKRLQILTYVRQSWPLSSEGSLACHTYCDMGHPFMMSSPRIRDSHTCLAQELSLPVLQLRPTAPERFENQTFRLRGELSVY